MVSERQFVVSFWCAICFGESVIMELSTGGRMTCACEHFVWIVGWYLVSFEGVMILFIYDSDRLR